MGRQRIVKSLALVVFAKEFVFDGGFGLVQWLFRQWKFNFISFSIPAKASEIVEKDIANILAERRAMWYS
jgi:hypothetical protein